MYISNRIILTVCFALNFILVSAGGNQEQKENVGIQFTHQNLQQALQIAENTNKLIFIDCFTTWCGPCKVMDRDVFNTKEVGAFFNKHFINIKYDMEKEDGLKIKKQFSINAYPTFLVLNTRGEVIHKHVGSLPKESFLAFASDALSGNESLAFYHERYKQEGASDYVFVKTYLNLLKSANEQDHIKDVISNYLEHIPQEDLLKVENWAFIKKYVNDIRSKSFRYLLKNQDRFVQIFGEKEIKDKIYFTYLRMGANLCDKQENGTYRLNEERNKFFQADLLVSEIRDKDRLNAYSQINVSKSLKKWKKYADLVSKNLTDNIIDKSAISLYNYALPLTSVSDKKVRQEGIKWCELGIQRNEMNGAYSHAFKQLKNDLAK